MHLSCHAQGASREQPVCSACPFSYGCSLLLCWPPCLADCLSQPDAASLAFCPQALPACMTHSVALPCLHSVMQMWSVAGLCTMLTLPLSISALNLIFSPL